MRMKKLAKRTKKVENQYQSRKHRVNTKIKILSDLPRLVVNKSNMYNYAQVIDTNGNLIASFNDVKSSKGTKVESAKLVGEGVAKKTLEKGITKIVFDRNGFPYHGRIQAIADGAREAGLQF